MQKDIQRRQFLKQVACGISSGLALSQIPASHLVAGQVSSKADRPNIVWFMAEDISPYLSAYGDTTANTPNIDRLAAEGVVYNNCFSVSGVCAPSRSCIMSGMYPTSVGTHNMRVNWATPEGLDTYWVPLPDKVKAFTQHLRIAGYFCTNNEKEDYNFNVGNADWDVNSSAGHWRKRPEPNQPFFSVFTSNTTHESRIWQHADHEQRVNPDDVPLPPYYPDTPAVRKDVARNYSNIEEMDAEVGELLAELEEDNLLDKTIFIFYGDNGGPLPRQKRELYDSGMRVPLIIRFPDGQGAGTTNDDLVSFVDFGVTMLSLAGIPIPDYYQGQPFLGAQKAEPRNYVFGARDRMDTEYDMVRAVRDHRYKYLRNYKPELPYYQDIQYRLQMDMMNEMLQMHENGELNAVQELWFRESKPEEELYDTWEDPHELNNLADDPACADKLTELRTQLEQWQEKYGDLGFIDEKELRDQFWPDGSQPRTAEPVATFDGEHVSITCDTPGAHIVYMHVPVGESRPSSYPIYTEPVPVSTDGTFYCKGERYGYKSSRWVKMDIVMGVKTNTVKDFKLSISNYPNPFNPSTTITFQLPKDDDVALAIYNVMGEKVRTLVHESFQQRGNHSVIWDGKTDSGRKVNSGTYFCKLISGNQFITTKILMIK